MKILNATLFLILIAVSPALAQWNQNGKPDSDTPDRKSLNGFGAQLIVVKNPRDLIEEWLKPETPNITPAKEVTRADALGAFVFFAGCKKDSQGICNTEVDYTIYKPDGSLYGEQKNQPLWKEEAPPEPNIQMGRAILMFQLKKNDPAGEYKVKAKVSDLNAKVSFELETKFRLK